MIRLPDSYSKGGVTWALHKRGERTVMYKEISGRKSKGYDLYEVFEIRVAAASEMFGKEVPERERIPSAECFGHWAWSPWGIERAEKIFEKIENKHRDEEVNNG